jgi:8-oxo-dGTP diphosphatase
MTMTPDDYFATLPRKRTGAAVLFRDADDRILLVEPTYKDYWELPGGAVDPDESPRSAAAREIDEELGLRVAPGRLLVLDWVSARTGRPDGLMLVFDGGVLDPGTAEQIRLPADELRSWAWCDIGQARQRLSPVLARRADAARQAIAASATVYLEDGRSVL